MATLDDINSTQQNGVRLLGQIATAIANAFPRINGTFTLSAATTTVVTQASIAASGMVFFSPTNATGALIQRTNGLFVSAVTSGSGFTMSTQSGSATSGGTFAYIVLNPS